MRIIAKGHRLNILLKFNGERHRKRVKLSSNRTMYYDYRSLFLCQMKLRTLHYVGAVEYEMWLQEYIQDNLVHMDRLLFVATFVYTTICLVLILLSIHLKIS